MIALFLIPFYIVFSIYICRWLLRFMHACHHWFQKKWMKELVIAAYAGMSSTILISFFLPVSRVQRVLKRMGNYWLGILLYIFLVILVVDLLRIAVKKGRLLPDSTLSSRKTFVAVGTACICTIAAISAYGIWNARQVHTTSYDVTVSKEAGHLKQLKIALVADFHLGYSIGAGHMKEMVERINAMDADLVVIAGDIFDNEYEAVSDPDHLSEILRGIRSRYGVYACYGNHDIQEKILVGFTFPGKGKKESDLRMDAFLEESGITLLRDESVLIDDAFYLVGRPDYEKPGRGIGQRKSAGEIVDGLDRTKPILVLEHEPRELEELSAAGVDMHLCGHTHNGQVWPGNLTVKLFWENPYGYLKKGDMHSIVTSGIGVYGPAMRVATKSEVCEINVLFQ